jgi:hypothetical protein
MKTPKITAETITDEQIETLLESCDVTRDPSDRSIVDDCYRAIGIKRDPFARARCAEILNARGGQ